MSRPEMETKTYSKEKYVTHLQDSKKPQRSTGILLSIEDERRCIFLYSHTEQLETNIIDFMEINLPADVIFKKVEAYHKASVVQEGGTFVVNDFLDETEINELLKTDCYKDEPCIKATVYKNDVPDCNLRPGDVNRHISRWMEQNQKGYLEILKRGDRYDIQQADTDEDGIRAVDSADLEHSDEPFFPNPSLPQRDPKKSPEILSLINKIRRNHNCPEENLPSDVPPEQGNDLEEDAGVSESGVDKNSSGERDEAFSFESKTGTYSTHETSDTTVRNVTFLLNAPAAEEVADMGFASIDIEDAITKYTKMTGNVNFNKKNLLNILLDESPEQETASF